MPIDPRILADLPPLAGLSPPALRALAARATERRFADGEVLFTAGSPSRGLFIIRTGRVRVLRHAGDRARVVHAEGRGGTLGEVPLFAGGGYPATAIAAAPTRCVVLSRDCIGAVIAADPAAAWVFLERLAVRVRTLVERLDRLTSRDVTARLAAQLLARHEGAAAGASEGADITQAELAEDIGTVREVVVRALRTLHRAGAIRREGRGRWRVADPHALRRLAARDAAGTRAHQND